MATHLWLFPWLALIAGLAALALGFLSARAVPSPAPRAIPRAFYPVWLGMTVLLTLAAIRLGAPDAEFVTARGVALGALGGWALTEISRRRAGVALAPLVFGLGTALVAAGRLWVTHGEVSGLTALAVGAALAVLCLSIAPTLLGRSEEEEDAASGAATIGLLYLVCLLATVQIGFTRAAALTQEFWADVPLLLGAALALGSAVSAGLAPRMRLPLALPPLLGAALLVLLPLSRIAPSWRPAEMLLLGAVCFGLLARTGRGTEDRLGPLLGFLMAAAGSALAFALWSGYGLGLLILGGWLAGGTGLLADSQRGAGRAGLGFAALLLVYRLATLQSSPAVHASGPGDIWDLFAVCLGALLPLLAAEWAAFDGAMSPLPRPLILLQWLFVLLLPALLLDYIWQPRSVAGVVLGAAVGQLLMGQSGIDKLRQNAVTLGGVLFSLALFQFLPLIQHVNEPTRPVRVGLVLVGASLLVLRLLAAGAARPKEEEERHAVAAPPRA